MPKKFHLPCFHCRSGAAEWSLIALKYALDTDRLCNLHKALAEERIKNEPEGKEEIQMPALKSRGFLPPILKRPMRDWTEKEPNNGELIE